jgi:cytochrome c-type biogenesis protein CcsB
MKKILDFFFSTKVTLVLLLVFAIGTAVATFIEDRFDTVTAKLMVYDARWFEALLLLLVLNFIGNIKTFNLLSRKRITGFVFHFAFIIIILGAGVTRYFGFDGTMPIREGKSSDVFYSSDSYFQVKTTYNNKDYFKAIPLPLSEALHNSFKFKFDIEGKGNVQFAFKGIVRNAVNEIKENVDGGKDILELNALVNNNKEYFDIKEGESKEVGDIKLSFNNNKDTAADIRIIKKNDSLMMVSRNDLIRTTMQETEPIAILKDSFFPFKENYVYKSNDVLFLFKKIFKKAKIYPVPGSSKEQGLDAVLFDITCNNFKQDEFIYSSAGYAPDFQDIEIAGIPFHVAYGYKEIKLPFSLSLEKFVLERYPGSMSPSSFASNITLNDPVNNKNEKHTISMNNVLDYEGYRFFQSSYDADEKGTIFSVNHDFWGTWITYLGYFLLGIGFLLTLINRNSRFYALRQNIKKIREKRKAGFLTLLFIICLSGVSFSQDISTKVVSKEHADKFGHLIVQTFDGRFEPVHTLAFDLMHKISRKDQFDAEFKGGKVDAVQVLLDMLIDPAYWKQQKIIYIREKSVQDVIGVTEGYASFNDFFDPQSKYKLSEYAEKAFRKSPAKQNTFDKDIIKVDERVNLCMTLFQGSQLKIFPAQNSISNQWVNYSEAPAKVPLTGSVSILNDDLQLKSFTYSSIFDLYIQSVFDAIKSKDYALADKIVKYIESMQRQSTSASLLPSKTQINYEIFYNKAKIFEHLRDIYSILSLVMLVLAFIENLRLKKSKFIRISLNIFIALLGIAFLYHTFGMGIRWYLTGHAPWSNGYEALLLVAWGGILAGFCFLRYSKITLASTALLAFIMLMTAGLSNYDPQLTNLQPVLKSYWLILHVAGITISYGFLGLGIILGLMNMFIYLFKTSKNNARLDLLIKELTYINEMNLEIGLFLATIGTFLGGIWANVSWGRYWGWDAKETWALIIVVVYAIILHLRLIPKLKGAYIFNVASIVGFGTVLMTFIGVNYYLSKGLHSYGTGDTPIFPIWAWIMIISVILLIVIAGVKEKLLNKKA